MSIESIITDSKNKMLQSIEVLKKDYSTMRTSRATPSLLSRITVNQYGSEVPLQHVASVSAPDPKSLVIQPWDKTVLSEIESYFKIRFRFKPSKRRQFNSFANSPSHRGTPQ